MLWGEILQQKKHAWKIKQKKHVKLENTGEFKEIYNICAIFSRLALIIPKFLKILKSFAQSYDCSF